MNIRGLASLAFARYSLVGFTFLSSVLIARHLGPEQQGNIISVVFLSQLFSSLLCINLPEQLLYYWSSKEQQLKNPRKYVTSVLIIYFLSLVLICKYFTDENFIVILYSLGLLLNNVSVISARALNIDRVINVSIFIQGLSLLFLVILGIELDIGMYEYIYIYILTCYIPVIIVSPFIVKARVSTVKEGRKVEYIYFIKQSMISHGSKMSMLIESSFDRLFIMNELNSENLAYYSVSQNLSSLIGMIFQLPLNATILPYLNSINLKERWSKTFDIYIKIQFSIVILTLIALFLSDMVVTYIYGDEYSQSIYPLKILLIAVCFRMPIIAINYYFRTIRKPQEILKASIISTPVNVILVMIGVNEFGIIGAAYASLVSYILFALISIKTFYKYKDLQVKL